MAQYTPALAPPPAGAELVSEIQMLWGIAQRHRLQIYICGTPLDMQTPPTDDEIFTRMLASASIDFATLKAKDGSLMLDDGAPRYVQPPSDPQSGARFDVIPNDVAEELAECAGNANDLNAHFSHLLVGRRAATLFPKVSRSLPPDVVLYFRDVAQTSRGSTMPLLESTTSIAEDDTLMTEDEVSARYRGRIAVGTLRNWRALRIGPPYIKIGKAVFYERSALRAWDRKNTVMGSKLLDHSF